MLTREVRPVPSPFHRKHLIGLLAGVSIIIGSLGAHLIGQYIQDSHDNETLLKTAVYTNVTLAQLVQKAAEPQQIILNASFIPPNTTIVIQGTNLTGRISNINSTISALK